MGCVMGIIRDESLAIGGGNAPARAANKFASCFVSFSGIGPTPIGLLKKIDRRSLSESCTGGHSSTILKRTWTGNGESVLPG